MRTLNELISSAREYTDAGEWKHSWHWRRDAKYNSFNVNSLKDALRDLRCDYGSMENEIEAAVRRIKRRYALADEIKEYIDLMEKDEI